MSQQQQQTVYVKGQKDPNWKKITVSPTTYNLLKQLGMAGDSFEDVIKKLLLESSSSSAAVVKEDHEF
jgi:predicted CopG family antitoxin